MVTLVLVKVSNLATLKPPGARYVYQLWRERDYYADECPERSSALAVSTDLEELAQQCAQRDLLPVDETNHISTIAVPYVAIETGVETLAVDVGYLLEFQRAYQCARGVG